MVRVMAVLLKHMAQKRKLFQACAQKRKLFRTWGRHMKNMIIAGELYPTKHLGIWGEGCPFSMGLKYMFEVGV